MGIDGQTKLGNSLKEDAAPLKERHGHGIGQNISKPGPIEQKCVGETKKKEVVRSCSVPKTIVKESKTNNQSLNKETKKIKTVTSVGGKENTNLTVSIKNKTMSSIRKSNLSPAKVIQNTSSQRKSDTTPISESNKKRLLVKNGHDATPSYGHVPQNTVKKGTLLSEANNLLADKPTKALDTSNAGNDGERAQKRIKIQRDTPVSFSSAKSTGKQSNEDATKIRKKHKEIFFNPTSQEKSKLSGQVNLKTSKPTNAATDLQVKDSSSGKCENEKKGTSIPIDATKDVKVKDSSSGKSEGENKGTSITIDATKDVNVKGSSSKSCDGENKGADLQKLSNELTDTERAIARAKRFGASSNNVDEKKEARAARFGISLTTNNLSSNNLDLLKKRAERFGQTTAKPVIQEQNQEKINARILKYGKIEAPKEVEVQQQPRKLYKNKHLKNKTIRNHQSGNVRKFKWRK